MVDAARRQWQAARAHGLTLPEAFEDFPWGRSALKVRTGSDWPPVFLWLGDAEAERPEVYVKLEESYEAAVQIAGAVPTTISGVGRYGRLTIGLPVPDLDLLLDWIEESYRAVAPRRLVTELLRRDGGGGGR